MKKLLVLLIAVFIVAGINAQNNKRTSAFNYYNNGKLDKAKEYIDPCITHEKTMGVAKTWYYRGDIYLSIAKSTKPEYQNLDPNALMVAYESYKKALELDNRGEYTAVIQHNYIVIAQEFFSQGVKKYNEQDFLTAADKFYTSYTISSEIGQLDTMALQNTAISYDFAKEYDRALEKYMELIEVGYNKADVYNTIATIYINEKKDTLKGEEYLHKGRELFPADQDLLITVTNLNLARGEDEQAIENLNQALLNDPTNTTIWHALGTSYENVGNMEEAERVYLKCIEVDPTYADAYYNIGAMYSNKASTVLEEAYELPLEAQDEYDAMMVEAHDLLKQAYPYLEKFLELKPLDISTLQTLKQIYTILEMEEELKVVNEKLAQ